MSTPAAEAPQAAARPLRCVVVGGSLIGLSTAIALSRLGFEVTVAEQSPARAVDGGGGLGVDVALLREVTGIDADPPVLHGIDRDGTAWHLLQAWLEEHAERLPGVSVLHGTQVSSVTKGDNHREATFRTTQGDAFAAAQSFALAQIVGGIAEARENARQVREQISSEMWEELNRLFHESKRMGTPSGGSEPPWNTTIGGTTPDNGGSWTTLASPLDQPDGDDGVIIYDANGNETINPAGLTPNNTGSSQYAEVSYFLRHGNLIRRVLLIRQPYDQTGSTVSSQPFDADTPTPTLLIPGLYPPYPTTPAGAGSN